MHELFSIVACAIPDCSNYKLCPFKCDCPAAFAIAFDSHVFGPLLVCLVNVILSAAPILTISIINEYGYFQHELFIFLANNNN